MSILQHDFFCAKLEINVEFLMIEIYETVTKTLTNGYEYLLRIFKLDSTRSSGSSEARADSLARLSIVFFRPTISASASNQARLLIRLFCLIFQEKTKWEKPVSTVPFTGLFRLSPNYGEKKEPYQLLPDFFPGRFPFHSIVKEDTEKNRISDRTGIGQSLQGRGCLRVVSRLDIVKPGYLSVPLQKLP